MKLLTVFVFNLLKSPVVKKFSGAMFAQGMLSATNFIVAFSIAKCASKTEYGMYVIFLSVIEIFGNYQQALVNTPLTVLAPNKDSSENVLFISGLGFGQWLFFLPVVFFALTIVTIYSFIHQDFIFIRYALVLSLALFTSLLCQFIRTINYSKMRIRILIKMDGLFVVIVAVGIYSLILFHNVTSGFSVLVLGIGYFGSTILGILCARDVYNIRWKSIKDAFAETWQYSRWALISATSGIFQQKGYIYIVTGILGVKEIADISVARLLLRPIGLFLTSAQKISIAKGAEVLNIKGFSRFRTLIISIACLLVFICISYFIALWLLYDYIISFLGPKYRDIHVFVFLWGIFFLIYSLRYSITNALVVCKEFKALSRYDIVNALFTIPTCLILTKTLESSGAVISLILSELVLLLFSLSRLYEFSKNANDDAITA